MRRQGQTVPSALQRRRRPRRLGNHDRSDRGDWLVALKCTMRFFSLKSILLLLGVLAFLMWDTTRETARDGDLGYPPAALPHFQSAFWSLPLALLIWVTAVLASKLISWAWARFMNVKRS